MSLRFQDFQPFFCILVSLFCCLTIPSDCLIHILWYALTLFIAFSQAELRLSEALVGGVAIPDCRLGGILPHTEACGQITAQTALGFGVALLLSLIHIYVPLRHMPLWF